uniref:Peptidase A2 domain-containing protein n=1 Tax=Nothobranchius pienaari TaxID=704102 RepID=A0A1A8PNI3_9TELE
MGPEETMQLPSQLQAAMQSAFLPMMTEMRNMMNMICTLQQDVEGVKHFVRDFQAPRAATSCLAEKPPDETRMLQADVLKGSDSQENNNTSPIVPSVTMINDAPVDDGPGTAIAVADKILLAPLDVKEGTGRPSVEVTVQQRHRCDTLLDTGSDITIMSKGFYNGICEKRGEGLPPHTHSVLVICQRFLWDSSDLVFED